MNLYDEYTENDGKKNKTKKYILIAIIIVTILIITLIGLIFYLVSKGSNKINLTLNGKVNNELLSLLSIEFDQQGNMQIYAPIKEVAEYFGYNAYNGSYTTVSEDTNSCNVRTQNEVAIFQSDSDVLYKLDLTVQNANYEVCKLDEKVFKENDKLYTTAQGLEDAFNITISYNAQRRLISIYTLDQYITELTAEDAEGTTQIQKYGYAELDETFANQKAIVDDMLVVITETGEYGVIKYSTGEPVLGTQYDFITYIPQNSAFLIQSNNKYGIISAEGETKIRPAYDSLSLIDNEKELYLASNGNLYGVVDINGREIIHLEYDKIGIDLENFADNNITNAYILQDTLIPVSQDDKWGFFDIQGNQVTDINYDNVGCITKNTQGASHNLLEIPEYDVIAVGKNEKYGFIKLDGKEVVPIALDDVYMQSISGETNYYMVRTQNGETRTRSITEYLEASGITKK